MFRFFADFWIDDDLRQLDLGSDERERIKGQGLDRVFYFDGRHLHVFSDGRLHALGGELVAHQRTHFFFDFDNGFVVVLRKATFAANLGNKLLKAARNVVVYLGVVHDY